MMLRLSGLLLRLVDYRRVIEAPGSSLGESLSGVELEYPRLRDVLRNGDGDLRPTHRIFINGELAPAADLTTPVQDSDDVELLTAIAGG